MKVSYSPFDINSSAERISEILDSSDYSYTNHKGIPSRDRLTFTNGFYVDVTVLFIDIRGSKELIEKQTRPVLAKIYRTYISEVVALLKGNQTISEIYIEGDGVWGVFNTISKLDVNSVFVTAFEAASLINILNLKLKKKGYTTIEVGIGVDDGESLYIKAGHKGSSINEVVWIGKVVGNAANLCSFGNKTFNDREIMVSSRVFTSLSESNQKLLSWNFERQCYNGDVVSVAMQNWINENG